MTTINVKYFLVIGLCLGLASCVYTSSKIVKSFVEPQYGMTRRQLIDASGDPEAIEIYKKPDQTRVEFYIYARKYESSREKVPVCLVDNKVVGWGEAYYEDHVSTDDIRIK